MFTTTEDPELSYQLGSWFHRESALKFDLPLVEKIAIEQRDRFIYIMIHLFCIQKCKYENTLQSNLTTERIKHTCNIFTGVQRKLNINR